MDSRDRKNSTSVRLPNLSARLTGIVEMVPACNTVYDIGSDHALVPIRLAMAGLCNRAYAGEVRDGPLKTAGKRIREYGMEDVVFPVHSDGLDAFSPASGDTVVLAGLGGNEIVRILERMPDAAKQAVFVFQSMKSTPRLRAWLDEHGFRIEDERLHRDGRRIYCVIRVRWQADGFRQELTPEECYAGPCVLKNRPPLFTSYMNQLLIRMRKELKGAPALESAIGRLERMLESEKEQNDHAAE